MENLKYGGQKIDYRLLTPEISDRDLTSFVNIINSEWGNFFRLREDILMERLNKKSLFIGCFLNDSPAGILETIGLELEYPQNSEKMDFKEIARSVCSQIGVYDELTNNGLWREHPSYANTLVLVDITRDPDNRNPLIASGIVDFGKSLMLQEPQKRPKELTHLISTVTFTPDKDPIIRWHEKQWAFNTGFKLKNARQGYTTPDVNFMCYMAPGYLAELGQRDLPKSA